VENKPQAGLVKDGTDTAVICGIRREIEARGIAIVRPLSAKRLFKPKWQVLSAMSSTPAARSDRAHSSS
jgi:hypothetical protein